MLLSIWQHYARTTLTTTLQMFRISLQHTKCHPDYSDINIRIDFQRGLLIPHNQYLIQIRITCPPSKETCLPRRLLFRKDSPRGTSPTTIRNHIPKRFELIFLYIYISSYGERSFIQSSIQHILMFNTFHHPIIPSPHHPLSDFTILLLFLHIRLLT